MSTCEIYYIESIVLQDNTATIALMDGSAIAISLSDMKIIAQDCGAVTLDCLISATRSCENMASQLEASSNSTYRIILCTEANDYIDEIMREVNIRTILALRLLK